VLAYIVYCITVSITLLNMLVIYGFKVVTFIPYFLVFKFVRVCSLIGRYSINVYIVESLKLCFPLMLRILIYFHVNMI